MGSSGGGGGSGRADWPDYMKVWHGDRLDEMAVLLAAGVSANPYTGLTPFNPDANITAMFTAIDAFDTFLDNFDTNYISAAISDMTSDIIAELAIEAIPQFEAGMSSINAVQSTGFVMGNALILGRVGRSIAREATMMHHQAALGILDGKKAVANMAVETNRMNIVAKVEEFDKQVELDVHEATWPFELYMYAGNLLGSIGGGHHGAVAKPPSKTQSALGGAMAGAATGAMVGGAYAGVGAVVGAVVGGVAGYLMA